MLLDGIIWRVAGRGKPEQRVVWKLARDVTRFGGAKKRKVGRTGPGPLLGQSDASPPATHTKGGHLILTLLSNTSHMFITT